MTVGNLASLGDHHYEVVVCQLYTTPKQPPSLNPILSYDYCIYLFVLFVIHSCEPVELPVWLSNPLSHRLEEKVSSHCVVAANSVLK